jgi:hypothetical protein
MHRKSPVSGSARSGQLQEPLRGAGRFLGSSPRTDLNISLVSCRAVAYPPDLNLRVVRVIRSYLHIKTTGRVQ